MSKFEINLLGLTAAEGSASAGAAVTAVTARARTAKKRMVSERVRMGVERCGAVGAQRRSVGSWRR